MRAFQHFIRLGVGKSLHGDYRFARKHEQLSHRHETRLFKFFAIRRRHAALLQCIDLKHRRVLFSVRARGVCILFDVDPVQSRPISSVVAFSSLGRKDARIDDDRPRSRLDRRAARDENARHERSTHTGSATAAAARLRRDAVADMSLRAREGAKFRARRRGRRQSRRARGSERTMRERASERECVSRLLSLVARFSSTGSRRRGVRRRGFVGARRHKSINRTCGFVRVLG